ncbi:uncharacterized protein LOC105161533 [Sesamum indicum]|uniref:Uncharacterized protein LOC105161533 n=1 Tax=Sesamum indicum TaxID=4182 RepID=A0A6I9T3M0_SESIN|nr:uncharacterized protein LOC105161533 [Sesamum indicum]
MATSANAASTKCYSGILRRLLCSGSLPTHPSDQLVESSTRETGDQKAEKSLTPVENVKQAAVSSPGVVARLMGLDSLPNTPLAPKEATLGSFFRSRSVNSIDFLSHFDPIRKGHHQHRRVRTSVSFCDGRDDETTSVVLYLEEVDETAEYQQELVIRRRPNVNCQKGKKTEKVLHEKRVAKKPSKKLEMEEERRSVGKATTSQKKEIQGRKRLSSEERRPIFKSVNNSKEELMGSKCMKKRKNKMHSGCSLKKVHPEGSVPARKVRSRKHQPSQVANSESPYSSSAHSDDGEVRAIITGKNPRKVSNKESCYYKRMVEEICSPTDDNVKENWMHGVMMKFEDFEEICQQFGQEILELLLEQLVDELLLLYSCYL